MDLLNPGVKFLSPLRYLYSDYEVSTLHGLLLFSDVNQMLLYAQSGILPQGLPRFEQTTP